MNIIAPLALALIAVPALALPPVPPQAISTHPDYETQVLLSVGDLVPDSSRPGDMYQFIGIPDGLGAAKGPGGTVNVWMNHELVKTASSEPRLGAPLQRGAFVSLYNVDQDGIVLSGRRAFDTVWMENTLVGPAADASNTTPAFSRFCSAFLATKDVGFDRNILLTGEESDPPGTFDAGGGLSVAIFDGEAHALPRIGRFAKENQVVQPKSKDKLTVIISLEDGPSSPDSQLWLYVGEKQSGHGQTVLGRNGLDNGELFVLRSLDPSKTTEADFHSGALDGEWVRIPGAAAMSSAQLEVAADAAGAFGFVRLEDGTFDVENQSFFHFVTTGSAHAFPMQPVTDRLGRLYTLALNERDPRGNARLHLMYEGDAVIAAGGDIALSPDNIAASKDYLVICEDGTGDSRPVMASRNRDGSIWRFELDSRARKDAARRVVVSSATRIVELDPPGRGLVPVGPGVWETSGIIDTDKLFDKGSFVFDVQAHSPTPAPFPLTIEDGQLLLLREPAGATPPHSN